MNTDTPITWPSSDFSRIPFAIYHDRALYEMEQERIFKGPVWNYLALEAELPKPGDFVTVRVGDTPVLVNRSQNGTIHAFINRCMHRGAELRREPCGNALLHTCVYHQWNYTLEGNLRGVPFASGVNGVGGLPPDFKKSDIKLRALKVSLTDSLPSPFGCSAISASVSAAIGNSTTTTCATPIMAACFICFTRRSACIGSVRSAAHGWTSGIGITSALTS
jgi:nitrite reductase/ring-hydroxylating ferredoxin subunit